MWVLNKYVTTIIFTILIVFIACTQSERGPSKNTNLKDAFLENGKKIAAATFAELSGQLQKAIGEGGIQNAIQYCQLNDQTIAFYAPF